MNEISNRSLTHIANEQLLILGENDGLQKLGGVTANDPRAVQNFEKWQQFFSQFV